MNQIDYWAEYELYLNLATLIHTRDDALKFCKSIIGKLYLWDRTIYNQKIWQDFYNLISEWNETKMSLILAEDLWERAEADLIRIIEAWGEPTAIRADLLFHSLRVTWVIKVAAPTFYKNIDSSN